MSNLQTYLALYSIAALLSVPLTYKWSEYLLTRLAEDIRNINAREGLGFGVNAETLAKEHLIPWRNINTRKFTASTDMEAVEYQRLLKSELGGLHPAKVGFLIHTIIFALIIVGVTFLFRFPEYRLPYGASLLLLVLLDALVYVEAQ